MENEAKTEIPNNRAILRELHCSLCLAEAEQHHLPPAKYAKLCVGYTSQGIQVWCERHEVNVIHWHIPGRVPEANTRAQMNVAAIDPRTEKRSLDAPIRDLYRDVVDEIRSGLDTSSDTAKFSGKSSQEIIKELFEERRRTHTSS